MSNNNRWFSGTLRFYWATAKDGCIDCEDSVYLVKAPEFADAFQRLIAIGRAREKTYRNVEGEETRERFVGVTTLDALRATDLDGAEVASKFLESDDPSYTFDAVLHPEESEPGHQGV